MQDINQTILAAATNAPKDFDKAQKEISAISADKQEYMKALAAYKAAHTPKIKEHKIGRNDPCPCGATDENGKPLKYKNCCLKTGQYEKYTLKK